MGLFTGIQFGFCRSQFSDEVGSSLNEEPEMFRVKLYRGTPPLVRESFFNTTRQNRPGWKPNRVKRCDHSTT